MASEVDRLLIWMSRVEQLEDELQKANPAARDVIFAQLVPAQRAQSAAFTALLAAAHRGDPEALVALDALESEIEEKTWTPPSPPFERLGAAATEASTNEEHGGAAGITRWSAPRSARTC